MTALCRDAVQRAIFDALHRGISIAELYSSTTIYDKVSFEEAMASTVELKRAERGSV